MLELELDRLCAVQLELAIERLSFKFIRWLRKYKSYLVASHFLTWSRTAFYLRYPKVPPPTRSRSLIPPTRGI